MRSLEVYYGAVPAGIITEDDNGHYTFTYTAEYVGSDFPPISVTLPKRLETYTSQYMFPFFSNMLPEGVNRSTICRNNHIDEKDSFGLLSFFAGKDIIGNVSLRRITQ